MTMQRFYAGQIEQLSDDEVAGICITGDLARDGDVWVPAGVSLAEYRENPVVLRDHNPAWVIGTAASIGLSSDGSAIGIRIQFAPAGVSDVADEARGLAKAGMLRGISAGIDPIDVEPLRNGTSGVRITRSTLLEVSLVAIPADVSALITARSFRSRPETMTMLRSLPTISSYARERVLDRMRAPRPSARPVALLDPCSAARLAAEEQRRRTMAAWAVGQARDAEQRARGEDLSYAQRQADLRRLAQQD